MSIISEADFSDREVMEFLAEQESQEVRSADCWRDELIHRLDNPIELSGIKLPFPRTHGNIRLRPSEVSVWFGRSGHYKSTLVNQVALYATQETRVGIMSFEMPVDVTLERITKQACGTAHPPKAYAHGLLDYLSDKMWIYDHMDMVAQERALACMHYMASLGIKLIVLDCLIMVKGIARDNEAEAKFMGHLIALAKAHKIHIALVHHPRKADQRNGERMPTRDDMRGASDLGDMASSIFIVHHNKQKKEALLKQAAGAPLDDKEMESLDAPCQFLKADKQRNSPFEGIVGLMMNREAMQFRESDRQHLFMDVARRQAA